MARIERTAGSARCFVGITPEDIVHDALQRLLLGDTDPRKGRKLSPRNRRSQEAFLRCVMGVINSIVGNAIRSVEFSIVHVPLACGGATGGVDLPDRVDAVKRLEHRDVKRELFARLRQQASPELQPIIDYWEPRYFADDTLARAGHDRRQVYRVRILAREILRTLAREFQPQSVRGMEMIL